MRLPKLRKRTRAVAAAVAALVLCLGLDVWLYPRFHPPKPMETKADQNGIWLRYTWYFGERRTSEVEELARRLSACRIRNAYFHVRFIRKDGKLAFQYEDHAKELIRALRRLAPEVRPIAWIFAGNDRGGGEVDLHREPVRSAMVESAKWLVDTCGFSGVQWDYEACADGDEDFLALLEETRAALPRGAVLSIAAPVWMPVSSLGWSEEYFGKVAARCDQIAVMCYDTGAVMPRIYVWLVAQQVIRVTRAVAGANSGCSAIFGLPTYEEGLRSHSSHAENLAMALRGIQEALESGQTTMSAFGGVAPFADYTMDESEWALLRNVWRSKAAPQAVLSSLR